VKIPNLNAVPAPILLAIFALTSPPGSGADYAAPAGTRAAMVRPGATTTLPGGRTITPLGRQYRTGPGPFGLAVSPDGKTVVTANGGPNRYSLTILRRTKTEVFDTLHWVAPKGEGNPAEEAGEWQSVFMGLAFEGNGRVYASEGNSGRIRVLRMSDQTASGVIPLDQDSYSGDLAFDTRRKLLYVVDQAHFRVAVIDTRRRKVVSVVRVGRLPFAIALSPDGRRVYVTNLGMFEYRAIPGADPKSARETGLFFPAFGFPSLEARAGAVRHTARGPVEVPGLGDPNVRESNSLCVINVEDPLHPRIEGFIRTGKPFSPDSLGGSSPSGVLADGERIYVSNAHNDSISVIDAGTLQLIAEIPIRVPGLEGLRGVLPIGLALHRDSGWLLAAEAGINAIGVIDTRKLEVAGHIPVGWFPTAVRLDRDTVYVTNAKGFGTGPNADNNRRFDLSFQGEFRRGTVSIFPLPGATELLPLTVRVLESNGFVPAPRPAAPLPEAIRHVVLIVKENRTFDEVFGDVRQASNGSVNGLPVLARFGRKGLATPPKGGRRLILRNVDVTPNHHALAERWAFSDNFYADSEVSVDGHHWLVGSYPNAWTESSLMAAYGGQKDFRLSPAPGRLQFAESSSSVHPEEQLEAGAIWHHLDRHGVSFRSFGEGFELAGVNEGPGLKPTGARYLTNIPMPEPLFRNTSREYPQYNTNIPDQYRASQFIAEIERLYVKGGETFPRFIYVHLPNDHLADPRPEDGYPYDASFMADNDYALGRIIEYLSHTPWWRQMAVLITEDDAQGWVDHIDSHRTVLLIASPYAKRNYVSRVNSSFPGLLKTALRLLGLPPLNLFDAAASDLADCFTTEPDFTPYKALPPDPRVFDPEKARDPLDPKPGPRMDDPEFLREQHRSAPGLK